MPQVKGARGVEPGGVYALQDKGFAPTVLWGYPGHEGIRPRRPLCSLLAKLVSLSAATASADRSSGGATPIRLLLPHCA